jgi:hypothetical protein
VRSYRWFAWVWFAGFGVVLAGAVATVGYGRAVDAAATYGQLARVVWDRQEPLRVWVWISWAGLAVSWLVLSAWFTARTGDAGWRRVWQIAGLLVPGVNVVGAAAAMGLAAKGLPRWMAMTWVAALGAFAAHVAWPLGRALTAVPAGAAMGFVSGDARLAPAARDSTVAMSDAATLPVRGGGGIALALLFVLGTAALVWRVSAGTPAARLPAE